MFQDDQNENQFEILTKGKNKDKTRMTSEQIDFLVGLQDTVSDQTP